MSSINYLKKNAYNTVVINDETENYFYPVTTAKAVYYSQDKTLYDILTRQYSKESTTPYENGIYPWLEHLDNAVNNSIDTTEFENYKDNVNKIDTSVTEINSSITKINDDISKISTALSNKIKELENRIKELEDGTKQD